MTVTAAPEPTGALAIQPGQTEWTEVQKAAFASIGLSDVPDPHRLAFLHLCQAKGLDPWQREIYLIGRRHKIKEKGQPDRWEVRYTPQTGIDGYLTLAEGTGRYEGRLAFEWCGDDGVWKDVWLSKDPPAAARARVMRKGTTEPIVAVAHWAEYAPLTEVWGDTPAGRRPTGRVVLESPMWKKMPAGQLAKCAFALALRAAFPRALAGIFVDEEMHQADARVREEQQRAEAEARAAGLAELRGEVIDAEPVVTRADLDAEFRGQAAVLGRTPEQLAARWAERHGKPLADATDAELYDLILGYREIVREAAKQTGGLPATAEEAASERAAEASPPAPPRPRPELLAALDEQARVLGKSPGQHVTRLLARERCSLEDVPDAALAAFLDEQRPFVEEALAEARRVAPADAPPASPPSPAGDTAVEPHPFRYNVPDGDNTECDLPGCGQMVDAPVHAPQPGDGQEPLL